MTVCLKPSILFSAFLFLVSFVALSWLGDIVGNNSMEYDFLVVSVQVGSVLFNLISLIFHFLMLKSNGYFMFGSLGSYLFLILTTLLIFSCFTIAFMISNVWAQDRLLNLGLFLVLDSLQCIFVGLSLFVQKSSFDDFVLKSMKLNTKNGNPIDARTAGKLYRLKFGRKGNKMFNDTELERLRSYMIPEEEDLKKADQADSCAAKNDGYYYCATAMAV